MLEEILETLKKLMECPSVTSDKKMTNKLLDDIKEMMPDNLIIKKHDFNGYGALVISNTVDEDFDIVFSGHIDVVPCLEYKYVLDEEKVRGRGSIDMKGAIAVFITLFKHLNTSKKVALFITSDEETEGMCSKELVELYPNIKLTVIPDGGKNFELVCEEKGSLQLKLSVNTKSCHASQPYNGKNAITTLFNCYEKLLEHFPLPKDGLDFKTSVALTKINGGTDAINQIPGYAEMYLDIRHVASDKKEDIINLIKKINPDIKIEIIIAGSEFVTPLNNHNVKEYIKACKKVLGYTPKQVKIESTSDAIYFYGKKIPTVIMNPIGDNPHCENEYVDKASLLTLYKIYETLLKEGVIK